jgi:hypothetical protein
MTTTTKFKNTATGSTIELRANFAEASSPIQVRHNGGHWWTTVFQVADSKHDPRNALLLILHWEG